MTRRLQTSIAAVLAAFVPLAAPGQDASEDAPQQPAPVLQIFEAADADLEEFKWTHRPVVVFADSPADPRFTEQIEMLTERPAELIERDVVVITDTDPDAESAVRRKLRPRGFQLTLIGKDGQVKLRKPSPWSAREISRSIDKMPLRQREIREQKAGAG